MGDVADWPTGWIGGFGPWITLSVEIGSVWDCDMKQARCWEDRLVGWEMVRLLLLLIRHSLDCRPLPPPSLRLHCLISATLSHWTSSSSSIYNLNAGNKLMGLRKDNQEAWIHLYCGACLLWWCRMQNLLLKRVASFSKLKSFDKGRVITYGGCEEQRPKCNRKGENAPPRVEIWTRAECSAPIQK